MRKQLVQVRLDFLRRALDRLPEDAEIVEIYAARSIGIGSHAAIELADPDDVRAVAISSDIPMLHERLAGQRRAVCFAAGVEFFAREEVRSRG